MFIIYDAHTNDYVCRAQNGQYTICRNLPCAALFTTERGAQNILSNGGLPKLIASKHTFTIAHVSTKAGKANKILIEAKATPPSSFDFSAPAEIRNAAAYLGKVMENAEELAILLSNIDREISDIQHYIETANLNAAQRSHVFKIFREKLNERRLYKNLMDVTGTMAQVGLSKKNFNNTVASLDGLDTKQYAPRSAYGETLFKTNKVEE